MITKEQSITLQKLVYELVSASEHLGSIDGSWGWNEAYTKQEVHASALREFIKSITEGVK